MLKTIISFFSYFLIFLLGLTIFYIFKPFQYVNRTSYLICNSNQTFEIGPNLIYSLTGNLDNFNDKKARKLCQHQILRDYQDTYKTPEQINYKFVPKFKTYSNWGDLILVNLVFLVIGIFFTNKLFPLKSKLFLFFVLGTSLLLSLFFFLAVLKTPSQTIFCNRQIAIKTLDIRKAAYHVGVVPFEEENEHLKKIIPPIFKECVDKIVYTFAV